MVGKLIFNRMIQFYMLVIIFFNCGVQKEKLQEPVPVWEPVSFPVMTYNGPSVQHLSGSYFQGIVDAGFTVDFFWGTREANLRALDFAQNAGLKLLIGDNRIKPDAAVDLQSLLAVDSVIADYKDHPALFGYFLKDEPRGPAQFENIAKLRRYFNAMDPKHLVYINLLPNYGRLVGVSSYEEYVSEYMKTVRPQMLSFDHYGITVSGLREGYYKNLEIIRRNAQRCNVPFWAFTIATEHYSYPMPTEGHIRFQLYSNLAYGAKGLQYYKYGHVEVEGFRTAPLDAAGNKTPIWYMARNVNREILQLIPVLKTLTSVDVFHSSPLPVGTKGIPGDFLITSAAGEPFVLGYFRDREERAYVLLVHRNYNEVGDVIITVSEEVKGLIEISRDDGSELPALIPVNRKIALRFEAGAGRLFRVE